MAYIVRKSGKNVLKNLASAEQRVFAEERKLRGLQRDTNTLTENIDEQKQELKTLAVEKTQTLLEMKDPQREQERLTSKNKKLTTQVSEAQVAFKAESEKKKKLPASIEKQVTEQTERFNLLNERTDELSEEVTNLEIDKTELQDYITKGGHIRIQYEDEKEKLDEVRREVQTLRNEAMETRSWMKTRTKELDDYKEYMKDYSGRLTSSKQMVAQITEMMNRKMKTENIKIRLELPVDKVDIPF